MLLLSEFYSLLVTAAVCTLHSSCGVPQQRQAEGNQVCSRAEAGGLRSLFDQHAWEMWGAGAKQLPDLDPLKRLVAPAALPAGGRRLRNGTATAHTVVALREVAGDFLKRMPTQKCASCGCNNPSIKRWALLLSLAFKSTVPFPQRDLLQSASRH